MQFFSSSQFPWVNSKSPVLMQPRLRGAFAVGTNKPELCGWYDSTFELCTGLEVTEQDDDTLYQLWKLSQR